MTTQKDVYQPGIHPETSGFERMDRMQLLDAYKRDFDTPWPDSFKNELTGFYENWVSEYKRTLQNRSSNELLATGEEPVVTPYDALKGPGEYLPEKLVADALAKRHFGLWAMTHPSTLEVYRREQQKGYEPLIGKQIPAIDRAIQKGNPLTFSDLAYSVEDPLEYAEAHNMDPHDLPDSAREIMGLGLFSWVTDRTLAYPYMISSTPDVVSAHTLATLAIAGAVGFVPMDGRWNNPDNQRLMYERALQLVDEDPFVNGHPEAEFLKARARQLIGVTVKANERDARNTIEKIGNPNLLVRVYDPRPRAKLGDTVRTLRGSYKDLIILAGPVVGAGQAIDVHDGGANGTSVGLMEGTPCETQIVASLRPENLFALYRVARSGVSIPCMADGGIDDIAVAYGIGASAVMRSTKFGNGIEKPPYLMWHPLPDGSWASNVSGEAGKRTKHEGGKVDPWGDPIFVEGTDHFSIFNPEYPSVVSNLYLASQGVATSGIFSRHGSLMDLQRDPHPQLGKIEGNTNHNNKVRASFRNNHH